MGQGRSVQKLANIRPADGRRLSGAPWTSRDSRDRRPGASLVRGGGVSALDLVQPTTEPIDEAVVIQIMVDHIKDHFLDLV